MNFLENWVPLPGSVGIYEVSNQGQIRSVDREIEFIDRRGRHVKKTVYGRVLRPWQGSSEYLCVYLCGNGRREAVQVHRQVAFAFLEKVPGKEFVNHIDGNKLNNSPENLEWCTRSENMGHARYSGLCKSDRGPVIATPKLGGQSIRFISAKFAAREIGKQSGYANIRSAAIGNIPSAYGFVWKYEREPEKKRRTFTKSPINSGA